MHVLIPQSVQLQAHVTLQILGWGHKQGKCVKSCARRSVFLLSERWKCQNSSAYVAAAVMWMKLEGCRVSGIRLECRHERWRGLCGCNLAITIKLQARRWLWASAFLALEHHRLLILLMYVCTTVMDLPFCIPYFPFIYPWFLFFIAFFYFLLYIFLSYFIFSFFDIDRYSVPHNKIRPHF